MRVGHFGDRGAGDNPEQSQLLQFLMLSGKASIHHSESNTICAEQRSRLCERALPLAERSFGERDLQVRAILENLAEANLGVQDRVLRINEAHYGKD